MGCGSSTASAAAQEATRRTQQQQQIVRGDPTNRRVRPLPPWSDQTPLSAQQLAMKRASFWESQTSGRPMVWSNLKLAAEAMIAGDFELACTVLEAADIRVLFGDLSVCYDPLGAQYNVPRFAFSNPTNVQSDEDAGRASGSSGGSYAGGGAGGAGARTRREYPGPVVDLPLTLRISSTTTTSEQDVRLGGLQTSSTVGGLKAALHEHLRAGRGDQKAEAGTSRPNLWAGRGLPPAKQRVMVRGRELRDDDAFLGDAGLAPGCTVQIFVRLPLPGQPE